MKDQHSGDPDCLHCLLSAAIGMFADDKRNGDLGTDEVLWSLMRIIESNRKFQRGEDLEGFDDLIIEHLRNIGLDVMRRQ